MVTETTTEIDSVDVLDEELIEALAGIISEREEGAPKTFAVVGEGKHVMAELHDREKAMTFDGPTIHPLTFVETGTHEVKDEIEIGDNTVEVNRI